MCLAMPVEVVELIHEERARVSVDGVTREISLALVDDVAVGDFVLLHAGFAIGKLDREAADELLRDLALLAENAESGSP